MNLSLAFYRLLARAATPLAVKRLDRRARDYPALQARRPERHGRMPAGPGGELWVHAASAGEVNAGAPLIQQLLARYPENRIVVSTHTHTGALRVEDLFGGAGRVRHLFAPLDTPGAVRRWLDRVRPAAGLVVETEIWPELFRACGGRGLPLALVNARISRRAFRRYRRFRGLFAGALEAVQLALCQSEEDSARLAAMGLERDRIRITGNLKFDFALPANLDAEAAQLRSHWGRRPVWVAGSTHEGEEPAVIRAHRQVLAVHPEALLVLVPRHPERGARIIQHLRANGLAPARADQADSSRQAVVVMNRMGILLACYRAAEVCFVGGSLVPRVGGHNLLEPALCAKPVITGPFVLDQQRSCQALLEAGALAQVEDAESLARVVSELLADPPRAQAMGSAGERRVQSGRGALARTMESLQPVLGQWGRAARTG